ncbi:alternate-type signal peptide domain-containing protein [Microbacterium sp. 179-B 1A2 NHS]|uniref:alternate-type signal peptide domain-containing protein n=1 Tax=Microbacterium sp. 179-B 1A2 NHS TaxID=3142383 RepID=UPI00399F9097
MKKFVKASIATAAGITLLLGGAGTFATWNASAAEAGASVVAGNLVVEKAAAAGVWKSGTKTIDINGYAIVPGETLTYTKQMRVVAEGDQLTAKLSLAGGAIAAATTATADEKLAGYLTSSAVLTATGEGIVSTAPNTFTVVPGAGAIDQTVTVTVSITFPKGTDGSNNDAKLGKVSLSDMNVALSQVTA